jgi:hypothetical protein
MQLRLVDRIQVQKVAVRLGPKCRREQRGEEDQSAEGGSVVKRIQVQKVTVAPDIRYTRCALCRHESAAPCAQTPHT